MTPHAPQPSLDDGVVLRRFEWLHVVKRAVLTPRGAWGLSLTLIVMAVAFIGPFLTPHDPTAVGFAPNLSPPTAAAPLGTDVLGRDVLSRVLSGGWQILLLSAAATAIGVLFGAAAGITAAFLPGWWDNVIMRACDVLLAFPGIVLALLFVSVLGSHLWLLVLTVGLSQAPQVARVLRAAALDIAERDYVKAIAIMGVSPARVMRREILPNLITPLMVESGLRTTYSIIFMAGLSFLGFGFQPPDPNWGYMINENRIGAAVNVWPILAPAFLLAILTIGINTFADALTRAALRIDGAKEVIEPENPPAANRGGDVTVTREAAPEPRTGGDAAVPAPSRLEVLGLTVRVAATGAVIVRDVSLTLKAGEVLGLVGESGSGKTTLGLATIGHTRRGVNVGSGVVRVNGHSILDMPTSELAGLWGRVMAYVPQDPGTALNPARRIGSQMREALTVHGHSRAQAESRSEEVLREVGLDATSRILESYPHQLSGGQQQRVAIAMAFACRPSLIVLDEPTTGLDVTTQRTVLDTVRQLCSKYGVAAVYVTHDIAVVAELADRVAVMYVGELVELGGVQAVLTDARHPYTRGLLRAVPSAVRATRLVATAGLRPELRPDRAGCTFSARCSIAEERCESDHPELEALDAREHLARCHLAADVAARESTVVEELEILGSPDRPGDGEPVLRIESLNATYGQHRVLQDVDLTLMRNECVALVGESGSGKTTLSRCLVGQHTSWTGRISHDGTDLPPGIHLRSKDSLRGMQYIFQNPYASLNPRRTIGAILMQPLEHFTELDRRARLERIGETMAAVSLPRRYLNSYPDQLSGGERQRAAIARALVVMPDVLVCDEVTSALDVSVQASIIEMLRKLQQEHSLALLFITHNLPLVRSLAQRVSVMNGGRIVESGPVADVLDHPRDEYTQRLLRDLPKFETTGDRAQFGRSTWEG